MEILLNILFWTLLILPPVFAIRAFLRHAWILGTIILILQACVVALGILTVRESARQSKCMANLHGPGKSMKIYSIDNSACFPSNWAGFSNYANNARMYVCFSSGTTTGSEANVDQWTDYVLVANLQEGDPAQAVLAFCPPKDHKGDGGFILFIEGSVEWTPSEEFGALLSDPCRFFGTDDVAKVIELQHRVMIRPPYDSTLRLPPVKHP